MAETRPLSFVTISVLLDMIDVTFMIVALGERVVDQLEVILDVVCEFAVEDNRSTAELPGKVMDLMLLFES